MKDELRRFRIRGKKALVNQPREFSNHRRVARPRRQVHKETDSGKMIELVRQLSPGLTKEQLRKGSGTRPSTRVLGEMMVVSKKEVRCL
jgi:hypothetical protein